MFSFIPVYLDLSDPILTEEDRVTELNKTRWITYLDIHNVKLTNNLTEKIAKHKEIKILLASNCALDDLFPITNNLRELEHLDISHNCLRNDDLWDISTMKHLTYLNISYNFFSDEACKIISNNSTIKVLNLGYQDIYVEYKLSEENAVITANKSFTPPSKSEHIYSSSSTLNYYDNCTYKDLELLTTKGIEYLYNIPNLKVLYIDINIAIDFQNKKQHINKYDNYINKKQYHKFKDELFNYEKYYDKNKLTIIGIDYNLEKI